MNVAILEKESVPLYSFEILREHYLRHTYLT